MIRGEGNLPSGPSPETMSRFNDSVHHIQCWYAAARVFTARLPLSALKNDRCWSLECRSLRPRQRQSDRSKRVYLEVLTIYAL